MKKLFLIAVLLAGSAYAQIPGQLDSLRARVFTRTQRPLAGTANATTAKAWQAVNDAQTPVCHDFDAYQKLDTLLVWGGPEGAALAGDVLRIDYVERMVGDAVRLPMIEVKQREAWEKVSGLADTGYTRLNVTLPRYWHSEGTRLFTTPKDIKTASDPDSLLVAYWAVGHNMTWGGDSTDIYPEYREALILKACANLCRMVSNFGDAAVWETAYAAEVQKYGRVTQK